MTAIQMDLVGVIFNIIANICFKREQLRQSLLVMRAKHLYQV